VLAAGVSDPVGTLSRLAALLEERTASLGFARETRPFLAHVTVARRKAGRGRGRGRDGGGGRERAKGRTTGVPPPASVVGEGPVVADVLDRVVLMRSTPCPHGGPGGPVYAVVAEAVLGG
jgi:2'-5' RNA ligase